MGSITLQEIPGSAINVLLASKYPPLTSIRWSCCVIFGTGLFGILTYFFTDEMSYWASLLPLYGILFGVAVIGPTCVSASGSTATVDVFLCPSKVTIMNQPFPDFAGTAGAMYGFTWVFC